MSTAAGGEIIVGGAITAALGLAALAVAAGGLAAAGGCYLICKGGCRAVGACKEKWQEHLKALESERQKRLRELRAEDERRMQNLQNAFQQWAQQGQEILRKQEEKIRQELIRQQAEQLEEERKAAAAAAARQHMEMMDQELRSLQAGDVPLLVTEEEKKNNYRTQLEQGRVELGDLVQQFKPKSVAELARFSFELPRLEPQEEIDTRDYKQRLAVSRARLVALVDLADSDRQPIQKQIEQVEQNLAGPQPDLTALNSQLTALEKVISAAQKKEADARRNRHAAWDGYFSLYDRYITASKDGVFHKILAEPLAKVESLLYQVKQDLLKPGIVGPEVLQKLQTGQQDFESEVEQVLQSHQANINKRVKNEIIAVLGELDYTKTEVKEQDSTIRIIGKGSKCHPGAEITLEISPDGYLAVDVSGKGFKNQQLCDAEFLRLQATLQRHGIYVDLTRCKKTWLEHMKQFLLQELQKQGYAQKDIEVDESSQEILKVFASQASQPELSIEINRHIGEITPVGPSSSKPIDMNRFFVEEPVEEVLSDEQTIRTEH